MKKKKLLPLKLILGMSMIFSFTGCVDQSAGIRKKEETPRIVATSVAVCEILEQLNLDLVGIPKTSSYTVPERYSEATVVGSPMGPDMEIIKSLQPTDVIGPSSLEADLSSQYEAIGVNTTFINLKSVEGMFEGIRQLGEKYDRVYEANLLLEDYTSFIEAYQEENKIDVSPRVLILMGLPGAYVVATEESYVGNLVSLAGGINVFSDEVEEFISVNTEALSKTDPDMILLTAHALPDSVEEMFKKEFSENNIWKHFRAVQEEKVVYLDYNLFGMSASFDYKEALKNLQTVLY